MADQSHPAKRWNRLGVLAGGGDLPVVIAQAEVSRKPFVVELAGFVDRDFSAFDRTELSVGQIGAIGKALKGAGCDAVCFAGYIQRPDLKSLKLDARGMIMVPKALAAGRKGDDALMRVVIREFESQGFAVVGANDVLESLTPRADSGYGADLAADYADDIDKATRIAREIGRLDIGQGAVVADGLVLAVEAQEGTNEMLQRVSGLRAEVKGTAEARRGVLAKMPKPIQERRIDLPTVGVETIERASAAGLAGIALQEGAALIINREAVEAALQEHNMFLAVVEPEDE